MQRRRAFAALTLSFASLVAVACFPDFQVSGNGDKAAGGDGDGSLSADGAPAKNGEDGAPATLEDGGMLPDGTLAPDGAGTKPDGSAADGTVPGFDAANARLIPNTADAAGGAFQFANPSAQNIVSVVLTHDFYMDTREATVGRFKQWVAAAKPSPAAGSLDPGGPYEGHITWDAAWNSKVAVETYKDSNCNDTLGNINALASTTYTGDDALPINCVNWFQAVAFCWWDGQKRLPTQVEWQWEASGRNRSRTYPWGDTPAPDCEHAMYRSDGGSPEYNGCAFPKKGGSAPLGLSLGGVEDMAGSLFEFTWDWQTFSYPSSWPSNFSGPDAGTSRMARGGSFTSPDLGLRTNRYESFNDVSYYADLGIRCVKTKL